MSNKSYSYNPSILKLAFSKRGMMDVYLGDGRIISVPLTKFNEIKKLTTKQRAKWTIIGGEGFTFDDCDEVYHIEQLLGNYQDYKYQFVNEPKVKYKKIKH